MGLQGVPLNPVFRNAVLAIGWGPRSIVLTMMD